MIRWISSLLLALLCSAGAVAQSYDKPQGYVSDFANVVDVAGRMEIEDFLAGLERGTGVQVAVVTVPRLNGEPIEDFTNTLFRKWGIGQKGTNEGLMVLFSIEDRRMRIEVGYGLEPILPDGAVGSIQRSLREELRAGKYGDAILKCVRSLGARIEQAKGVSGAAAATRRGESSGRVEQRMPIADILFIAFLLLFFVIPYFVKSNGGAYRRRGPGPFIGGGWGGGGFGGGGGWGGGSSGGGFGGFGGGDSGGGGSSSDW
jgi:uncharacterized protein